MSLRLLIGSLKGQGLIPLPRLLPLQHARQRPGQRAFALANPKMKKTASTERPGRTDLQQRGCAEAIDNRKHNGRVGVSQLVFLSLLVLAVALPAGPQPEDRNSEDYGRMFVVRPGTAEQDLCTFPIV